MVVWYHIETTESDGTTWRTSSPVPSWDAVVEWVQSAPEHYKQVERMTIIRYADITAKDHNSND